MQSHFLILEQIIKLQQYKEYGLDIKTGGPHAKE
jgi:hypothetical protein